MRAPDQDKNPSGSNMGVLLKRSFSTVILLGLLAGALWWDNELGYYGLVCIFCILSAWEWRHMLLRSRKASQPNLSFFFGAAYPVLLSLACWMTKFRATATMQEGPFLIPFPLMLALGAPVLLVVISFIREMKNPVVGSRALRSVATTLLSFIYPGWLFAFTILALHLAYMRVGYVYPAIVMCVLWVILVTKLADIFAYVSGFLLGGRLFSRRLIPHISPKKTWEGILGSWVLTNAAAIGLVFPMFRVSALSTAQVLVLAGCTSFIFLLSVYGDLAGSLVKRSLAIKDSGSLLPGIGGMFDLIDSPSFTIPFFWLLLAFIG
ncbi:phosphatidate cytidylyltransferase [Akkermansia muciniphila]|uniref:phosphatidate cytidylyltransferase n=1 Tax=Akkermansia muciniphila TaxID=239935 RepID=UPI001BFF0CB6|nr:phosphatidate cytidylyltransferase [Akkermansia muciniphila]MBT8778739.1 phosphatidate cytidylyltransferase [Akkermansia muciniphila]